MSDRDSPLTFSGVLTGVAIGDVGTLMKNFAATEIGTLPVPVLPSGSLLEIARLSGPAKPVAGVYTNPFAAANVALLAASGAVMVTVDVPLPETCASDAGRHVCQ